MLKNIIFDMDGVLVDSEKAIREACTRMLAQKGVTASHEDFIPFTGMGEDRFISGVAQKYGIDYTPDMKGEAYRIYAEISSEYVVVFDGIPALIRGLRELGYKLAVASAADRVKVLINLKCMGLGETDFDAVVTGSDVTKHKPDPEVFLTAAARLGGNPAESLVVEDAVSGCKAAVAAGMRCIGITTTFDSEKLIDAGAMFTTEKTVGLLDLLEKING